jgi:hypothetical protein
VAITALMRKRPVDDLRFSRAVRSRGVTTITGDSPVGSVEREACVELMIEPHSRSERIQSVTTAAVSAIAAQVELISMRRFMATATS